MARRIETFFIDGPVGRLEAMLEEPDTEAREAALVCHPHPLGGGTMHNKVVHRLARALRASGCAVLRFNFRGVNLSQGSHDEGRGEVDDAAAALSALRARYPHLPYTLAGFSFGSRMAIKLAARLETELPTRVIAVGYPTVYRNHGAVQQLRIPRHFVHSTIDEFGPRAELEALYAQLWQPKSIHWIQARDHFFAGSLDEFERAVRELGLGATA